MVDLHPAGATDSEAHAVAGNVQGGWVRYPGQNSRAVLWSGSAGSVMDMQPEGHRQSQILGMVEGQQVGWTSSLTFPSHAAIWNGTPESFIDLHPASAGVSQLYATVGSAQVGWANTSQYGITAGVWFGTAESFIPLAQYLPAGVYDTSFATSIAVRDGVYYVGGYALTPQGASHAFVWVGVPAPGTAVVSVAGVMILAGRRGR